MVETKARYERYRELADSTPGVHFVGRLATYRYYNMDQVVAQALTTAAKLAGNAPARPAPVTGSTRMPSAHHQSPAVRAGETESGGSRRASAERG